MYDKEREEMVKVAKEIAENHWEYIEKVILLEHLGPVNLDRIKFHYITALIHGFCHGVEAADRFHFHALRLDCDKEAILNVSGDGNSPNGVIINHQRRDNE